MATADDMRRRRSDPSYRQRENERQLERKHALAVENEALRKRVEALTSWPMLEGLQAEKQGQKFDASRCAEWQAGWHLAHGTKATSDQHQKRFVATRKGKRGQR